MDLGLAITRQLLDDENTGSRLTYVHIHWRDILHKRLIVCEVVGGSLDPEEEDGYRIGSC